MGSGKPPVEHGPLAGLKLLRRIPKASEEEAFASVDERLSELREWQRRLVRRGYLIDPNGHAWRVPDEVMDLYRELHPELGADLEDRIDTPPEPG